MWQEPIYDRQQYDVDLIKLDPTNENTKGAFNYDDLNRIESNCEYIKDLLNNSGLFYIPISISVKTDWNMSDIPKIQDINRVRDNIITLKNNMTMADYEDIEYSGTLDYIKANILEKDLLVIKNIIETSMLELKKCNTFYCGSDGIGLYTQPRDLFEKEKYSGCIYCGEEFRL